jgi:signal transduction histidine kinase
MKPRLKVIINIVSLMALAFVCLYIAAVYIVRPKLAGLQHINVQQSTSDAINAITYEQNLIKANTLGYSEWDDTYNYMVTHNPEFITDNMGVYMLEDYGINVVIITDTQGKVIYSEYVQQDGNVNQPLSSDILNVFSGHGKFLATSDKSSSAGLLALKSGILAFNAEPVLTSLGSGPYRGTITFGLTFDKATLNLLDKQYKTSMELYSLSSSNLPPDIKAVEAKLNTKSPITGDLSSSMAAGYQLIDDAYGNPSLVIRVTSSRQLFVQAGQNLDIYLVIAGFITLFLSLFNGLTFSRLMHKQDTINLKDEFLSVATHDLRTPLTAIRESSSLAIDMFGKQNADLTEMLNIIHNSSSQLIRLVNNYLDSARLEKGKMPFNFESVAINDVVKETVEELRYLATEKSLNLSYALSDQLPKVHADRDKLKQVFSNLIGNAIKFTDRGGVTINAKVNEGQVIVLVNDTGNSMSSEDQKMIFKRFQQIKSENTKSGSGLGLYITKLLVEKMGGKIWVDSSSKDSGTTVCFSLNISNSVDNVPKSDAEEHPITSQTKILPN